MAERLKNRYYCHKRLFIADMTRIFTNCRSYNKPDTEYYKCANTLEKFVMGKLRDAGLVEKWTYQWFKYVTFFMDIYIYTFMGIHIHSLHVITVIYSCQWISLLWKVLFLNKWYKCISFDYWLVFLLFFLLFPDSFKKLRYVHVRSHIGWSVSVYRFRHFLTILN